MNQSSHPLISLRTPGEARGRTSLSAASLLVSVVVAGILVTGSLAPPTADAAEYTPGRKFGRGLSNMSLGILALPGHMTKEVRERGWAIGLPVGFGLGLGWTIASEFVGVWEFLTCPFEFPKGFRPIIEPEFPWEHFTDLD